MNNIFKICTGIFVFIFTIVLCNVILHYPAITGLSDNGDFIRVMEPNNISYIDNSNTSYYFNQFYRMKISGNTFFEVATNLFKENPLDTTEYTSSQFFFIKLSKLFNYINNYFSGNDVSKYDITYLAQIYIVIFAIGFTFLYKGFESDNHFINILIFIILCLVFFDLGYIIYFNSFYGEALQYCTFILITGILVYTLNCYREHRKITKFNIFTYFLFILFTYIFACSKAANVPIAVIYSIVGLIIMFLSTKSYTRIVLIVSSIICIFASVAFLNKTPLWMEKATNFNAVFYGILKDSDTPEQDLFEMDINQRYISLANTNAYDGEHKFNIYSDSFNEKVYSALSKTKVLRYYLLHLDRFFEKLDISLINASIIKPMYLSNYTKEYSEIKLSQNTNFSLWSNFRNDINITNMYWIVLFFTGMLIFFIIQFVKFKKDIQIPSQKITMLYSTPILRIIFLVGLTLATGIAMVMPFMSNGEADLQKHMFLFNHLYDTLLVCILGYLILEIREIFDYLRRNKIPRMITIIVFGTIICCIILFNLTKPIFTAKEITFGTFMDKNITWQIIDETDEAYLLITKEPLVINKFDTNNSNYWVDSSIRKFLNDNLYNSFSTEEKSKILKTKSTILLAQNHIHVKEKGVLPYYWNSFTHLQDKDISRYYQNTSEDYIFLLNSFEYYTYITKNNIQEKENMVFMTPYANNTNMIRYIGEYGYIYINDANLDYSIYPCMWIRK
ncbi:MAG: hypothetical protein E7311_06015 [Clostridiales bacterium]|nr:hypothetical protein [Clostridiales bacterium]